MTRGKPQRLKWKTLGTSGWKVVFTDLGRCYWHSLADRTSTWTKPEPVKMWEAANPEVNPPEKTVAGERPERVRETDMLTHRSTSFALPWTGAGDLG